MRRHAEQVEQQNHEQPDDHPKEQVLHPGIHPDLLRGNVKSEEDTSHDTTECG